MTVEAYTITYARGGTPEDLILTAITPTGERILTRTSDRGLIEEFSNENPIGRFITIEGETPR